jgi:hypothetical protein
MGNVFQMAIPKGVEDLSIKVLKSTKQKQQGVRVLNVIAHLGAQLE